MVSCHWCTEPDYENEQKSIPPQLWRLQSKSKGHRAHALRLSGKARLRLLQLLGPGPWASGHASPDLCLCQATPPSPLSVPRFLSYLLWHLPLGLDSPRYSRIISCLISAKSLFPIKVTFPVWQMQIIRLPKKEMQEMQADSWSGRSPVEGNSYPLQMPLPQNPT